MKSADTVGIDAVNSLYFAESPPGLKIPHELAITCHLFLLSLQCHQLLRPPSIKVNYFISSCGFSEGIKISASQANDLLNFFLAVDPL